MKSKYNVLIHLGFILMGITVLISRFDLSEVAMYFGISLAFDPFNHDQPFGQRPTWQKVYLVVIVAMTFAALILGNFTDFEQNFRAR